tara:strand:+ start:1430 stop:2410 length:981 start_codon:yes stop_codon:yes gene_type:complete
MIFEVLQQFTWQPFGTTLLILGGALLLDLWLGEPAWLWKRLPHPVVLFGRTITLLDKYLNRRSLSGQGRRYTGCVALLCLLVLATMSGWVLQQVSGFTGFCIQVVIVSILLAGRSLHDHVRAVARPLSIGDVKGARRNLAMIVGRKTDKLSSDEIARAAIETTAENLSDGVIAPAIWYLVLGLPGLFIYKIVNTADSMIGYKNSRYYAFGWAAARTDDLLNLLPARLTAALLIMCGNKANLRCLLADAPHHLSPNAGWPETAMALCLGVQLGGPRNYNGRQIDGAILNQTGRGTSHSSDVDRALVLMVLVIVLSALICLSGAFILR